MPRYSFPASSFEVLERALFDGPLKRNPNLSGSFLKLDLDQTKTFRETIKRYIPRMLAAHGVSEYTVRQAYNLLLASYYQGIYAMPFNNLKDFLVTIDPEKEKSCADIIKEIGEDFLKEALKIDSPVAADIVNARVREILIRDKDNNFHEDSFKEALEVAKEYQEFAEILDYYCETKSVEEILKFCDSLLIEYANLNNSNKSNIFLIKGKALLKNGNKADGLRSFTQSGLLGNLAANLELYKNAASDKKLGIIHVAITTMNQYIDEGKFLYNPAIGTQIYNYYGESCLSTNAAQANDFWNRVMQDLAPDIKASLLTLLGYNLCKFNSLKYEFAKKNKEADQAAKPLRARSTNLMNLIGELEEIIGGLRAGRKNNVDDSRNEAIENINSYIIKEIIGYLAWVETAVGKDLGTISAQKEKFKNIIFKHYHNLSAKNKEPLTERLRLLFPENQEEKAAAVVDSKNDAPAEPQPVAAAVEENTTQNAIIEEPVNRTTNADLLREILAIEDEREFVNRATDIVIKRTGKKGHKEYYDSIKEKLSEFIQKGILPQDDLLAKLRKLEEMGIEGAGLALLKEEINSWPENDEDRFLKHLATKRLEQAKLLLQGQNEYSKRKRLEEKLDALKEQKTELEAMSANLREQQAKIIQEKDRLMLVLTEFREPLLEYKKILESQITHHQEMVEGAQNAALEFKDLQAKITEARHNQQNLNAQLEKAKAALTDKKQEITALENRDGQALQMQDFLALAKQGKIKKISDLPQFVIDFLSKIVFAKESAFTVKKIILKGSAVYQTSSLRAPTDLDIAIIVASNPENFKEGSIKEYCAENFAISPENVAVFKADYKGREVYNARAQDNARHLDITIYDEARPALEELSWTTNIETQLAIDLTKQNAEPENFADLAWQIESPTQQETLAINPQARKLISRLGFLFAIGELSFDSITTALAKATKDDPLFLTNKLRDEFQTDALPSNQGAAIIRQNLSSHNLNEALGKHFLQFLEDLIERDAAQLQEKISAANSLLQQEQALTGFVSMLNDKIQPRPRNVLTKDGGCFENPEIDLTKPAIITRLCRLRALEELAEDVFYQTLNKLDLPAKMTTEFQLDQRDWVTRFNKLIARNGLNQQANNELFLNLRLVATRALESIAPKLAQAQEFMAASSDCQAVQQRLLAQIAAVKEQSLPPSTHTHSTFYDNFQNKSSRSCDIT